MVHQGEDEQITRRDFLGGVAANAVGLTIAGTLLGTATLASSGCASATSSDTSSDSDASASDGSGASEDASSSGTSNPEPVDERYTADLTDIFADHAAFMAEVDRLLNTTIPALQQGGAQISDQASLVGWLQQCDEASSASSNVSQYANMRFLVDSADNAAQEEKNASSRVDRKMSVALATGEEVLDGLDEATWQEYLSAPELARWHRFLQSCYDDRSHALPARDEALLSGADSAADGVKSLYTTLSATKAVYDSATGTDGAEVVVTSSVYTGAMSDADRDYRQRAFLAYAGSFRKLADTYAGNFDTYVRLKEDAASAHGYASSLEAKLIADDLTQATFDTLVAGARASLDAVGEANDLRRRLLGVDQLMPWDRTVPLAPAPDTSFTYEDAQSIIAEALAPLGDDYAAMLQQVFSHRWIDVYPSSGKANMAATVPGGTVHPYIFMSYTDDFNSVSTLTHELGHLIHHLYTLETQSGFCNKVILAFTTEIASITNQVLLMDHMASQERTDAGKLYYISQEMKLLETSFFRQTMFADFEAQAHRKVADGGTLTADTLGSLFNGVYADYLPGIEATEENAIAWAQVPHFYMDHYVQRYAFATAGAFSAAARIIGGNADDLATYLRFLTLGNSVPSYELYAMVGVDLSDDGYLTPLVDKYRDLIGQAEALV